MKAIGFRVYGQCKSIGTELMGAHKSFNVKKKS